MGQFDNLLRCTLGGTHFQLERYQVSVEPIVKQGLGRVGVTKSVTGTGWIEATTASDFASRLTDARANIDVSGDDFKVYGIGSEETFSITAAECVDGGPHCGYTLLDQFDDSGLLQRISFVARGQTADDGGGGGGSGDSSTYQERVDTAASGLRRLTRTGEINQSNAIGVFVSTVLPAFRAAYPLPFYITSHTHEYDAAQRKLKYTLTADAVATPLPFGGGVNVVDGRPSRLQYRDEQDRVTIRYDFDLVLDSVNYMPIVDLIRAPISTEGVITRESVDFDGTKELRLRATFEIVRGDGTFLLSWKQSFNLTDARDTWRVVTHTGAEPFLVKSATGPTVLLQQGTAVGEGIFPQPATILYPDSLVQPPDVRFEYGNNLERITSWSYASAVSDLNPFAMGGGKLDPLLRPSQPAFVGP